MYFHGGEKHCPTPIIGALGNSTNCIVEQPNTAANIIIIKYLFKFMQACCVLLEKELWAEAEAAFTNRQAH